MNQVYKLIETLSKEECRNFKILLKRTNDSAERKDVALFDYARKYSSSSVNEDVFLKKFYPNDRNAFYRLKNRLLQDINKSLLFLHYNSNDYFATLNYIMLSKLFNEKSNFQLTFDYLLQAEKKAIKNEFFDLLDLIYNDLIILSIETVRFNPSPFIDRRKENRALLNVIQEVDNILASLTYKIKTTQNYNRGESNKLLQEDFYSLIEDKKIKQSKQLQFKVYHSISRILLQEHDFITLEAYLKKTYLQFSKNKLFTKSNHETKLQMLTYIVNSLFKNDKIEESLLYTEKLHDAMLEFDKYLYEKYLFYYYNSLVINYQVTDKQKAIDILNEAKSKKEIQVLPIYSLFIYLNLAVLYFDLGKFNQAKSSLVKLKQQDNFKNLDIVLQFKICIVELMIIHELNDIDLFDYQLKNLKKDFFTLKQVDINRDIDFVNLLEKMQLFSSKELKEAIISFLEKYKTNSEDDADIINYNHWLISKQKRGVI
ncbi:MAG: hypothetical protein P1U44_01430 [Vicingaceae bacterium]|mgnify:CR=1 FL=1|nr:hypothetical protein [Flavobacteriales bacterium]MBL1233880.1 hypothetical protein [Flavobacteriales bacterium]MBQ21425.1 hypothetical protein [Flavobacteriales bacterium]MDF1674347.1 hypothetical protein [Vicingaceae bacterium]|tara:strand:- start:20927 stop:22378 length:1452 start_codon:yes stop_codon:yes gene_type:complete